MTASNGVAPDTATENTMTTTHQKRTARLATFAVGAITVGASLAVTAPAANAHSFSESQIETFCHLRGGTYDTYLYFAPDALAETGERRSSCSYRSLLGHRVDEYVNGEYTHTFTPVL